MKKLQATLLEPFTITRCDLQGCEQRAIMVVNGRKICELHANTFAIGRLRVEEAKAARSSSALNDRSTIGQEIEETDQLAPPGGPSVD